MTKHEAESPVRSSSPCDGVVIVELSRPDRLNALNNEMVSGRLRDEFARVESDPGARAMILTGTGRAFSAGGDLESSVFEADDDKSEFIRIAQTTITTLLELQVPTIAAVNGPAAGGGMALALACDIRIAGPTAFFSCPFLSMALIPDFGASFLLTRAVGESTALALALTGRRVASTDAVQLGLAQELADDPLGRAIELAQAIAMNPPKATRATKQAIRLAARLDARTQILDVEPLLQSAMMGGSEFKERFDSYRNAVTKRPST